MNIKIKIIFSLFFARWLLIYIIFLLFLFFVFIIKVMSIHDTKTGAEKVLILSVDTNEYDNESSVEELKALVRTAGGETAGVIIQKLPNVNPASYIGSGKLAEAELFCHNQEIDLVVCDCTLTTTQQRFLKEALKTRVIDRTVLILDIFAAGAKTAEGKLQVEPARAAASTRAAPAKASWKRTGVTSAAASTRWKRS